MRFKSLIVTAMVLAFVLMWGTRREFLGYADETIAVLNDSIRVLNERIVFEKIVLEGFGLQCFVWIE